MDSDDVPGTLRLYRRLIRLPLGGWLFSRAVCWRAPYFATIRPRVLQLEPQHCEVRIRKRHRVQNHIGTVHAIAMANMCELAAGLMTDVTVPAHMRWIPKGMTISYLRKAQTDLRAVASIASMPEWRDGLALPVQVAVVNTADEAVVQAEIAMWVTMRQQT